MRKPVLWIGMGVAVVAALLLVVAVTAAAPAPLEITGSEPKTLHSETGGTLTIYGSGFTTTMMVRLVKVGLLSSTFVNSRTVTAVVPPGVAAGTYDLELSIGDETARREDALKIVAATAVPSPTEAPAPGSPVLAVRTYSVSPSRVPAGREFVLTIEIYNTGSRAGENTMVTFPGGTFLPVGDSGHLLGQLHINYTAVVTQVLRAPAELSSGSYSLQVNLSANDWEGTHYEYPQTLAVEVAGVGQGRPQLLIADASTTPTVVRPGDAFSLTLTLTNNGDRTATNVLVGMASETLAVPASGSNVAPLESVALNGTEVVTLPLVLSEVTTSGRTNLEVSLEYGDWQGGSYSARQTVGVEVSTTLADRPQVLVASYGSVPETVAPGDTFSLTLDLANVGGGDALRFTLMLGGEGGEGLAPFAPLASGNVRFIERLGAGGTAQLTQVLAVDGSAEPGVYSLPLAFAYDDDRGTRHEDSQRISLLVRRRPHLQIGFYETLKPGEVGKPLELPVEVTNIGRTLVNVSRVEVTSSQVEISDGSLYLGPLDGGTSGSLEPKAVGQISGTAEVLVTVHYLDDFDQAQSVTQTLSVQFVAPETEEATESGKGADGFWGGVGRFFRGLLGLGS